MPTYQYKCTVCAHEFEEFQRISEPPMGKCPECGDKIERIITGGVGFVLKGSGFYSTDHRSESYKAGAIKENSASAEKKGDDKKKSEKSAKDSKKND
jgi:putative FmdB family regulatory protein